MCRVRLALVLAIGGLAVSGQATHAASWHILPSFGRHGVAGLPVREGGENVAYPPGPGDKGSLLAPGPQGSIFVGGYSRAHKGKFLLARMSAHGALVKSFGHGGVMSVPSIYALPESPPRMFALAGGKLLLIGLDHAGHLLALRFSDTGRLDRGFGHGGTAQYALPGVKKRPVIAGASVESGGEILIVFYQQEVPEPENQPRITAGLGEGAPELLRLLPTGALDGSFGRGGFLPASGQPLLEGEQWECGVTVAPDGSVLLAYETVVLSGGALALPAVQELSPTGADAAGFGSQGVASLGFMPHFEGEDSIIFGGLFALPGGGVEVSFGGSGQLVRFTAAGALDPAFGSAGRSAPGRSAVSALALASDGETFWAHTGRSVTVGGTLANGALDPALGGAAGIRVAGLSGPRSEDEQAGLELLPVGGGLDVLYGELLTRLIR